MTVDVEDTQKEFAESWLITTHKARRQRILGLCLVAATLMTYSVVVHNDLAMYAGGAGIYTLVVAISIPLTLRNGLKKLWKAHPIYSEPRRYTIDDSGFSSDSYSGTSTFRWHAFSHWTETDRLFLIHFGPQTSYHIPKRCITDDGQIGALRDILTSYIGRTKYSPPVKAFPIAPITEPLPVGESIVQSQ